MDKILMENLMDFAICIQNEDNINVRIEKRIEKEYVSSFSTK